MKVNGKMGKKMVKGNFYIIWERHMKEDLRMGNDMVKELGNIQMEESM